MRSSEWSKQLNSKERAESPNSGGLQGYTPGFENATCGQFITLQIKRKLDGSKK
jgi:hypothetical protein